MCLCEGVHMVGTTTEIASKLRQSLHETRRRTS